MSDAASRSNGAAPARVAVRKTYKLYVGGAFPRSESGRSYVVTDHKGGFLANAALASRKDARDAVAAARKAFGDRGIVDLLSLMTNYVSTSYFLKAFDMHLHADQKPLLPER